MQRSRLQNPHHNNQQANLKETYIKFLNLMCLVVKLYIMFFSFFFPLYCVFWIKKNFKGKNPCICKKLIDKYSIIICMICTTKSSEGKTYINKYNYITVNKFNYLGENASCFHPTTIISHKDIIRESLKNIDWLWQFPMDTL